MIPISEQSLAEQRDLEALLAFDRALAAGVAFSPDGTILATGSYDGAIKLWRASRETGARSQSEARVRFDVKPNLIAPVLQTD
jgi:WD40 repeat protein